MLAASVDVNLGVLTVADDNTNALGDGINGDLEREVIRHHNHRLPLLRIYL